MLLCFSFFLTVLFLAPRVSVGSTNRTRTSCCATSLMVSTQRRKRDKRQCQQMRRKVLKRAFFLFCVCGQVFQIFFVCLIFCVFLPVLFPPVAILHLTNFLSHFPLFRSAPTFVEAIFGGLLLSSVTCTVCHTVSRVTEPFLDLSVQIPDRFLVGQKKNNVSVCFVGCLCVCLCVFGSLSVRVSCMFFISSFFSVLSFFSTSLLSVYSFLSLSAERKSPSW